GVLNEVIIRSEMLVKLLSFLVVHREHALTVQELSEALWQQDETDNPEGALKNLMYRLRNALKKVFGDDNFILTSRGAYAWNPDVRILVDAEEFERHCLKAREMSCSHDQSIRSYEAAIELYQGGFLAKYSDLHWVAPLFTYYHSMFLTGAKNLSEMYISSARYHEVEQICARALKLDATDEQLHFNMIKSLIFQKKKELATEHFKKAEKLLYSSYGERNSTALQALKEELYNIQKSNSAAQIEDIHQDMQEEETDGAFICAYPIFREIYRLEARKIKRFEMPEYVLLITLEHANATAKSSNGQLDQFLMGKMMDRLEMILKDSLRIGDVAARYSESQFVILLPTGSYESGMMIANRIIKKLFEETKHRRITVRTDIDEVTVAEPFKIKEKSIR
ncbi:MAG: BTAD domain-containing putative transcriptional regulator, partial [Candidatus Pacebacteria bacterium]|nr:BTAD domain-containing putative transcriptional regulator [Candidatus Paceibacterota bacterium]